MSPLKYYYCGATTATDSFKQVWNEHQASQMDVKMEISENSLTSTISSPIRSNQNGCVHRLHKLIRVENKKEDNKK